MVEITIVQAFLNHQSGWQTAPQNRQTSRRNCHRLPLLLSLPLLAVVSAGCGDNDGRLSISGTVKLDGKLLPEGSIKFLPIAGTGGPTAGGTIEEGSLTLLK